MIPNCSEISAFRISRNLSWNMPNRKYYSEIGKVSCPKCKYVVNLRDLVEKKGSIKCKACKK